MPTIADYLTLAVPIDNTPFWGSATKPAPIVDGDFQNMLTEFISVEYADYRLRRICYGTSPEQILERVQRICDNVYLTHAYTYQHLYDTTVAEYNPIENYNMVEHEETENDGIDKTTRSIGSHTDTTNFGEGTVTDIYGDRQTTRDTTADKAPFESQSYQHVDKSHDTAVENSATDRHTQSSRADSTSYGSRTDTDTLEHGHDITRDLTRSGNIGTTTTQMMLESERQLSAFNLTRIVANDIIHALCVCYEGVIF